MYVAHGLVQEQQIDVAGVKSFHRIGDRDASLVVLVERRPQLCGEEDLLAGDPRAADAAAHGALVPIGDRGVDEPVSRFQGRLHAGLAHRDIGDEIDAQADLWHPETIRERNARRHEPLPFVWTARPRPIVGVITSFRQELSCARSDTLTGHWSGTVGIVSQDGPASAAASFGRLHQPSSTRAWRR